MNTQYDAEGYAVIPPISPWDISGVMNQGQQNISQANSMLPQAEQKLDNLKSQQSGYPAMANDYGLGSTPGAASNPNYLQQPLTVSQPDSASRGFNPWSLTGEALSRGR